MKKQHFIHLLLLLLIAFPAKAENPFCFALFSDLHITTVNEQPSEDLKRAVDDVNVQDSIDFVLVTGDITEYGDSASLQAAKKMLDKLHVPYYIVAGNHDLTWQGGRTSAFAAVFGDNKFSFSHKGYYFIGFETSPAVRTGEGVVSSQDILWLQNSLKRLPKRTPVFAVTHYPLQAGDVGNWYEVTAVLRKFNIQAVLGGHYHRNVIFNYDGLPGIINRSTLRGDKPKGGYSIYKIVGSQLSVREKVAGEEARQWMEMKLGQNKYGKPGSKSGIFSF
ncbi:MAG: metallophosphoesterase [Prevotellaceae bacterium]|jgi:3',5'-cyclic AMP phosphodiesterase CpdA|nr:metallophosphoesterase [Prevotellaceae bacterium]